MRVLSWFSLILGSVLLTLVGCAGMAYKKCEGGKCAYYKDGQQLSDEEAAKENSSIAREVEQKKMVQERQESLKNAPRRGEGEEIGIAVLPAETTGKGQVTIDPRMAGEWRKLFENSAPLRLVDDKVYGKYLKVLTNEYAKKKYHSDWFVHAAENRVPGEVYVYLRMGAKEVYGISKSTKKLASGQQLVLTARVSSTYTRNDVEFVEPITNLLKNQEAFNRLADKVKAHINSTVRAELPSLAWVKQARASDKKNASEAFKKAAQRWMSSDKNNSETSKDE